MQMLQMLNNLFNNLYFNFFCTNSSALTRVFEGLFSIFVCLSSKYEIRLNLGLLHGPFINDITGSRDCQSNNKNREIGDKKSEKQKKHFLILVENCTVAKLVWIWFFLDCLFV